MKKYISICSLALILVVNVVAQKSTPVVKVGLNLANVSITEGGEVSEAKMIPSFHVGAHADIPVVSILSIQPGILFSAKGSKTQAGNPGDQTYYKATINPYYIEVPVNVVFKLPVPGGKLFAGAGPYAAMGIAGKNKAEGTILGVGFKSESKIEFSNDDPATEGEEGSGFNIMRRFDYGLNGTLGFEGKAATFSANYGYGLAKLQSGSDNDANDKNKHRVLSFTVGFKL